MQYIIVKRIKVEAETLEKAIADHDKGKTVSLTADEGQPRATAPAQPTRPISIRNPR